MEIGSKPNLAPVTDKQAPLQGKVIDHLARRLLANVFLTKVEVRSNDCTESREVVQEVDDFAGNLKGM
jgi:hypothetical protein